MDTSRSTEIRVGLVTVVAFALLIGGILLGEGMQFGSTGTQLKIRLTHSGGLVAGSPVMINGVNRGKVLSVQPDNASVLALVDVDDASDLRTDASARVVMLEITGGKKVEIFPGMSSEPFIPATQELQGTTASDISDLVTQVGDVSGDLVRLLRRLDTITAVIANVMQDTVFMQNVSTIASNGAVLMSDARLWLERNRNDLSATVADARATMSDVRRLVSTNEPAVTRSVNNLDARLIELERTLSSADAAIVHVDSLVVRLDGVVTDLKTSKGFVNAAMYDTNFRRRIDTAVMRLSGFVRSAREVGVNVNVGIGHR
jgi:phospholipid/cholesterol/gamma-HCH transport system substrate-binding protein